MPVLSWVVSLLRSVGLLGSLALLGLIAVLWLSGVPVLAGMSGLWLELPGSLVRREVVGLA